MMVQMLGSSYLGQGLNPGDFSIADVELDTSELTDTTGTAGTTESTSNWTNFVDGFRQVLEMGTDTAVAVLKAKKGEAASEVEVSWIDRLIEMKKAGLTLSEMKASDGGMDETTAWLVGGGILVAGVIGILAVTGKRRRRRR